MNWLAHAVSILLAADPGIRAPVAIGPDDEDLFAVDLIIGEDPAESEGMELTIELEEPTPAEAERVPLEPWVVAVLDALDRYPEA